MQFKLKFENFQHLNSEFASIFYTFSLMPLLNYHKYVCNSVLHICGKFKLLSTPNALKFIKWCPSICAFFASTLVSVKYFMISHRKNMSRVVRKPDFCICENKDADQLRGNREADQRLCFRYKDRTIPLLPKSKISSL